MLRLCEKMEKENRGKTWIEEKICVYIKDGKEDGTLQRFRCRAMEVSVAVMVRFESSYIFEGP